MGKATQKQAEAPLKEPLTPVAELATTNMRLRGWALELARSILQETGGAFLAHTTKTGPTDDLIKVAEWILDGTNEFGDLLVASNGESVQAKVVSNEGYARQGLSWSATGAGKVTHVGVFTNTPSQAISVTFARPDWMDDVDRDHLVRTDRAHLVEVASQHKLEAYEDEGGYLWIRRPLIRISGGNAFPTSGVTLYYTTEGGE